MQDQSEAITSQGASVTPTGCRHANPGCERFRVNDWFWPAFNGYREKITLARFVARHSTIWWPPVTNLDTFGGVLELTASKLVGIPTLLPNTSA